MQKENALRVSAHQQQAKRNYISRWFPVTALGILLVVCALPPCAVAQDVDPSKCFQSMLVNKYNFAQRENLLLSAMSIVNIDNWKDAGTNESLTVAYGGYSVTPSYNSYDKERNSLFEYNHLDINQYKEMLLSSAWISDRGYDVIEKCLNATSGDRDGFHYTLRYASPSLVSIQFHWSDPKAQGASTVKIKDSTIVNGNVDGVPPHKLSSTPITVGKASVPIFIKRESTTDDIFITVTTDLDRQPDVIPIKHLVPEKPILFRRFVKEIDNAEHVVQHTHTEEIKADNWQVVVKPDDGYEFAEEPSCAVNSTYGLSNVHILGQDYKPTKFVCHGTQNANPRFIDVKYIQGKWEERCVMGCDLQKPVKTEAQNSSK